VADKGRRKLIISPRVAGVIGCVVTAVLAYGAITTIDQGRGTVPGQWRLAVTVGAGTSTGLIMILAAALAAARWRKRTPPVVVRALSGLLGGLLLITWAALHVLDNGPPAAWQVGLAAFLTPVAGLALLLIPLLTWRTRPPGGDLSENVRNLVTVTITARKNSWTVGWIGLVRTPRRSRAPTLASAVDQVIASAPDLQSRGATELWISIYPGRFRGGPSFDITGEPGDLTATSARYPGQEVRGRTVEDLVGAIEQSLTGDRRGFRLRWTWVITAPIPSATSSRHEVPEPADDYDLT
jgi:hypothetical protein